MVGIVEQLKERKAQLELELQEYPAKEVIEKVAGSQLKLDYKMLQEEISYIDGRLKIYLSPIENLNH
jgi:FtsZ-binding cell division protein ZapB